MRKPPNLTFGPTRLIPSDPEEALRLRSAELCIQMEDYQSAPKHLSHITLSWNWDADGTVPMVMRHAERVETCDERWEQVNGQAVCRKVPVSCVCLFELHLRACQRTSVFGRDTVCGTWEVIYIDTEPV